MKFEQKEDGRYYCKDGNCSIIIDTSYVLEEAKEIQKKLDVVAQIYIRALSKPDMCKITRTRGGNDC